MASIFRYRKQWRAQVSVGEQSWARDFHTKNQAKDWARTQETEAREARNPELGGPECVNLAQMLSKYLQSSVLAIIVSFNSLHIIFISNCSLIYSIMI